MSLLELSLWGGSHLELSLWGESHKSDTLDYVPNMGQRQYAMLLPNLR